MGAIRKYMNLNIEHTIRQVNLFGFGKRFGFVRLDGIVHIGSSRDWDGMGEAKIEKKRLVSDKHNN